MSPPVLDIDRDSFEREVLDRSHVQTVVVDFWADWCAPCRTLGPLLEAAVERTEGRVILAKVDVEREPELAGAFGVSSIPAVCAFRNGRVVAEFVGVQPAEALDAWLRNLGPSAEEEALAAARQDMEAGRSLAAEQRLRRLLEDEPSAHDARLALARLLVERGAFDAGRELLAPLASGTPEGARAALERSAIELLEAAAPDAGAAAEQVEQHPEDSAARFALAGALWQAGRAAEALDALLELVQRDRGFGDDVAHRALLALFDRLGEGAPEVGAARRRLGMILFR
jgi:putative thioredoxin